jgi:hypothetical protein
MKRTVWKYPLDLLDEPQSIHVPDGGQPIHVATQEGRPCIWFDVEPERPLSVRRFTVEGTGHPIRKDAEYIGTCHAMNGQLVWHVYEDCSQR